MTPPPADGSFANRAFFAWRSATRLGHSSAWPDDAGPSLLLSVVRRRSWGSTVPFAGLIPQPGGHSRRINPAAWQVASSRRPACRFGISAGPGPRVVRASASAPIDFRRGDRTPVEKKEICQSDRPRMRMASTSGLRSRLRSVSLAHVRPERRSCLGLCLLQGCRARCCASERARPRRRSPASGTPRRSIHLPPAIPIRSWVCRRSFRSHRARRAARRT